MSLCGTYLSKNWDQDSPTMLQYALEVYLLFHYLATS